MSVRLGAAATLVLALAGLFYYDATPGGHNRALMSTLAWIFVAGSSLLLVVPMRRIVGGRARQAFFIVWSGVSTGAIALTCTAVMSVWTAWWRDRQREELARLSRTDPLTGTLNRRGLDEAVGEALDAGTPFGLITLDLDDFKAVNDSGGHAAGDALLADVVGSLQAVLRPGDIVGRLGGDEFAVLLPGATPAAAARVRERAQLALSFHVPASSASPRTRTTAPPATRSCTRPTRRCTPPRPRGARRPSSARARARP